MYTKVEPQAKNTIKFLKYIVESILAHEPIRKNKLIEVLLDEDNTPLPEFLEAPILSRSGKNIYEVAKKDERVITIDGEEEDTDITERILDTYKRGWDKFFEIFEYLRRDFRHIWALQIPIYEKYEPMRAKFPFIILQPQNLYELAKNLGIKNYKDIGFRSLNNNFGLRFQENPPQIIFNNIVLPIKFSSLQSCICRVAFTKKIGEPISWEEVAEEIDGHPKERLKTKWRRVYYAVRRLNQRFIQETAKPLFKWENLTFYRLI